MAGVINPGNFPTSHAKNAREMGHPAPDCVGADAFFRPARKRAFIAAEFERPEKPAPDECVRSYVLATIWMISARTSPSSTISLPTVTGKLKRRGPALPGLK